MICNVCGTQDATLHLTEIVNKKMVEIHLCEQCSREKGSDFKSHFNLGGMFAGGEKEAVLPAEQTKKQEIIKCADCELTYGQFAKSGRLGCAHCYESFHELLVPMFRRIQKSEEHLGKKPGRVSSSVKVSHDLRKLQDQLTHSIASEEFEHAAKLRDQIQKIQEKLNKANKNK